MDGLELISILSVHINEIIKKQTQPIESDEQLKHLMPATSIKAFKLGADHATSMMAANLNIAKIRMGK